MWEKNAIEKNYINWKTSNDEAIPDFLEEYSVTIILYVAEKFSAGETVVFDNDNPVSTFQFLLAVQNVLPDSTVVVHGLFIGSGQNQSFFDSIFLIGIFYSFIYPVGLHFKNIREGGIENKLRSFSPDDFS